MGFLPEVTAILDEIPEGGQRLLFSATLDKGIDTLVDRYLVDPVTHSTDEAQASVTTMSHHVLLIDPQDKKAMTAELAGRGGRVIVFARTQLGSDRIAGELRERGVLAASLHGGLSQAVRNRVLGAFRSDGSAVSLGDAEEFFLFTEYVEGTVYAEDFAKIINGPVAGEDVPRRQPDSQIREPGH